MTYDTMNNDVTLTGGENPLLAGRYQVVRQLGSGGMGAVWLAEDTLLDNKQFAVKMLPSILVANKRAYRQLKNEALVAMKLVHPNIMQIRAFEENNGNPFLVMDYIEGQTLDDYLAERGTLSEDETIKILKPVAAALDYAHGEGVVHRDVKPANVMIRKDGRPFVLDFGIAREMQETMTRVTGKFSSGTLLYMSPEQLNGDPPKKEQDVYSFAAMVYECLKGEPPFVRGQIEYQIVNNPPPPLSQGIASWLSEATMRGLAKKATERPTTCSEIFGGSSSRASNQVTQNASTQAGEKFAMVDCPVCGKHNRIEETFKCKICERDHLCASHFSDEGNCCKECAEKLRVQAITKQAIEAYNSNDYVKAFTLAQKSDQNSAVIQYILGCCFTNGYGCEKNQVEATKWYSKAANQGHEEARVCLENIWNTTAVKLATERKNFDGDKFWDEIKRDDEAQAKSEGGHCHSRVFRDELYDDIMRIDWPKALYMISETEKQVVGELEKEKQITKAIVNNDERVHNLSEIKVENPYLQFQIGMTFYAHPVAMNKELAARWFEKSAKQKCAPSLYMLGRMYEYGESVKQSYVKAKKLFDRVGIDEIPMSDVAIAHIYEFGLADAKDKDAGAAAEWYEYTVGHGCSAVMPLYLRALRMHYSLHPDIEQKFNVQKAAKGSYESFSMLLFSLQECTKSAEQGNVEDQNRLGWLYLTGDGVTQNDHEAMKWYRRAADQGDANALYNIGWMYGNGRGVAKDDTEAVKCYRKAAELGYVYAQLNLGNAYYNGSGVTKDDVEAVKWYTKAAEQGYSDAHDSLVMMAEQGSVDAQYNLALLYLNGKGVEKNSAEALKWFLKAAEQKNVDAQLWAGVMYGNGNGVSKNFDEAVKWYRAAADQGNAMAQYNLGVMYANGLGVKGNLSVAAEWYRKSAAQGNENAKEALRKIEGVLNDDEIFRKAMADFLKAKNDGVKKTASSEDTETSGLKTGTVRTLVLPGGAKMEVIYVAPGSFVMGSPEGEAGRFDNETQHRVTITKGYWLGKYPVTQEEWVSLMGENPARFKNARNPVERVSWEDCQEFCQKLNSYLHCGARLPTEAEWEYACRAGSVGGYGIKGSFDQISWCCDNSDDTTHPVGQKGKNNWGFRDMHGNVWEWCEDWYGDYDAIAQIDPTGPESGEARVARGGSWFNPLYYGRSAKHSGYSPGVCDPAIGFRLCCSTVERRINA